MASHIDDKSLQVEHDIAKEETATSSINDPVKHDESLTPDDIVFLDAYEASGAKQKLLRKMDLRLLPILILLYLVSFIDRGNIGNARIEGIEEELGLSSQQYSWCLTIFFFMYAPAEMPANVMLKLLRPRVWIPLIMFLWGTVMTLQGVVQNYSGLLATRAFLGITEAGFFPGAMFILSNWYLREEMGRRVAYLYASASLAGAFSGLLAFAIAKMDGIGGYSGWRWIFIIEGLATVVISLATPWILSDTIEHAKWLGDDERRYLSKRIRRDRRGKDKGPFEWKYMRQAFGDWRVWCYGLVFFGEGMGTYGLSFALPTIIRQLGYTAANAQLLTIPVYFAAALATLIVATIGDKSRKRAKWILIPFAIAIAGNIVCLCAPQPRLPGLVLWGVFMIAIGCYSSVPAIIAWCGNNNAGEWKRGIALGIEIGMGSAGGIVGSNVFLAKEKPRYWTGFGLALGLLVCGALLTVLLWLYNRSQNRIKNRLSREEILAKYTEDELDAMGNDSPLFRYEL